MIEEYQLGLLTDDDYGQDWNIGNGQEQVDQITKELAGFAANGRVRGYLSRYEHGLNLVRRLWPEHVRLYKDCLSEDGYKIRIWNDCFLKAFKALCENKIVCLTGAGSTSKTFSVAVYCILMFMSDPENTTIMVSTTGVGDAERRIWGELKDLHRMLDQVYPIGISIDYLKSITFDPGKELEGRRDVKDRDLRNGIMLVAIPEGSEGKNAVRKIIGTKNKKVIWVLEELPHMIEGVLRPYTNLLSNEWAQVIGTGNANRKTDPHGDMCEPVDNWGSVDKNTEHWMSKFGAFVLNLNGLKSPNFDPRISHESEEPVDYPFPFLFNPASERAMARVNGRGDIERGRKTLDYARFAEGFWYGEDVQRTILSEQMVKDHKADEQDITLGPKRKRVVAGFDCGFTTGGDQNSLTIAHVAEDVKQNAVLLLPRETLIIRGASEDRSSYRKQIAKQVVEECKKAGVEPEDFGMDINADGGLMLQEIQREWGTHDLRGLSSLEPTDDSGKYANRVTQYWYQVAEAVGTGLVRGFNCDSGYAKDLFQREYESVGKGVVQVEKKTDMRKRIRRSPDEGDSFCYMVHMAIAAGFELKPYEPAPEENRKRLDDLVLRRGLSTDDEGDDYHESHEAASEEESWDFESVLD